MTLPISWKLMPLGDVCLKITKGTTPTTIGGRFTDDGIKFIKVETISEFGSLEEAKLAFIDEESHEMLKRSQLEANDVLFSIAGAIGRTYLVKEQDIPANTNQALAIVRFNQDVVLPSYGFYALRAPYFQSQAFGRIIQCAQANVNLTQLSMSKIFIPPKIQQEQIVKILFAYDSLIENNRRRIQLLEQSARLLYREWFVHLRFPGHEHVRIIDGVPEGWEKRYLVDIADLVMGQSPKSEFYNEEGEGLPFHQGVTNFGDRFVNHEIYCTIKNRLANPGDILCSVRAPVGRLNITLDRIVIGRGLAAIRSKSGHQSFLYYQLKNDFFKEDMIGAGAIFAAVTKKDMENQELVCPQENLIKEFEEILIPIDNQLQILHLQNNKLIEARDLLLPRLMNGEITV